VPIPRSKAQRKAANRTQAHVNARLVGVQRQRDAAIDEMITQHDQKAHLARVLAYVIAANGGELVIPDGALAQIPAGARLQRYYDATAKTTRFVTVLDDDGEAPAAPKIEVVSPKIELVKA
jgi:hypothetical protein